jgi:hypothetical protein
VWCKISPETLASLGESTVFAAAPSGATDSPATSTAPTYRRRSMSLPARPFHLFALALAGLLNRRQAAAVEYLREENRVLRSRLPEVRLRFTDAERTRPAVRGAELGRALLADVATLASPDTILRWHRKLVAAKWTFNEKSKSDRAGLMVKIGALAVRFANDDPTRGYDRIQGALKNVGHVVAPNAVKKALKAGGVRALRSPPTAQNCNAFAERFAGTVCRELTDRMIFVGMSSLDRALREFAVHDNAGRNHQSLDNDLFAPRGPVGSVLGRLERRERLGGLLSFCVRRTA